MSLLTKKLPTHLYVEGLRYEINSDFRYAINFDTLMRDSSITEREKTFIAYNLFFGEQFIVDYEDALNQILWFYRCGKEMKPPDDNASIKIIYSFDEDAEYIFSGFWECYGIDLTTVSMHWWKFKALFDGLNEETLIKKIMHYRAVDITSDMSDSTQKFYRKMKRAYALPDMRSEIDKERDFANALLG